LNPFAERTELSEALLGVHSTFASCIRMQVRDFRFFLSLARLIAGTPKAQRLSTLSNRITSCLAQRSVSDATDCGARFHSVLDGFGLHVSPSHFGSDGFGQLAPNLGISIEHDRVNQSTSENKPSRRMLSCVRLRCASLVKSTPSVNLDESSLLPSPFFPSSPGSRCVPVISQSKGNLGSDLGCGSE